MSVAGCYTDWHIDFGGTSVWYHILHGEKVCNYENSNHDTDTDRLMVYLILHMKEVQVMLLLKVV